MLWVEVGVTCCFGFGVVVCIFFFFFVCLFIVICSFVIAFWSWYRMVVGLRRLSWYLLGYFGFYSFGMRLRLFSCYYFEFDLIVCVEFVVFWVGLIFGLVLNWCVYLDFDGLPYLLGIVYGCCCFESYLFLISLFDVLCDCSTLVGLLLCFLIDACVFASLSLFRTLWLYLWI